MSEDKEIRADAKLKNLSEELLDELWSFRHPVDEEDEKLTFLQIASEEVPRLCGYTVSLSTLHKFYKWLKQKRRSEAARRNAEQAKRDFLDANPDATVEELERLGQMVFTSETVEQGNLKGFVALMRASNTKRKLGIDKAKLELLQRKAEFADEVKKVAANREGGITAEEMADIERRLKLM